MSAPIELVIASPETFLKFCATLWAVVQDGGIEARRARLTTEVDFGHVVFSTSTNWSEQPEQLRIASRSTRAIPGRPFDRVHLWRLDDREGIPIVGISLVWQSRDGEIQSTIKAEAAQEDALGARSAVPVGRVYDLDRADLELEMGKGIFVVQLREGPARG